MSWFSASPSSQRWAFAISALVTATAVPAHAQKPPRPHVEKAPRPVHVEDPDAPTVMTADSMSGRPERELNLNRNVVIERGTTTKMTADTACYKQVEDEFDAEGQIKMWRFGDYYTGDVMKLNMETGKGFLLNPTYRFEVGNGRGKAERVDFINQDEATVIDGTYSTCEGPNPDWYLKSSTLNLDSGRDVGTGSKTIIYFKDVPILGTPGISFSLSGARRSGWLAPTPGFNSKNGFELLVPYYLNIAPNRDLTLYPKYIQRRGIQLGAVGRYLGETDAGLYSGETSIEYLPNDKQTKTDRYLIKSRHEQALAVGWTYGWDVRDASDNNYPNDFSKNVAGATERQLLRELRTDYRTEDWTLTARVQNYQVLQDPAAETDPTLKVTRPYDRLPSVNFHAGKYDVWGGFDWTLDSEVTRFAHPTLVQGTRMVVVPQVSFPIVRPGYFITPKLMLNASAYQLDNNATTKASFPNTSFSRAIPTISVDSGLIFERDSNLFGGKDAKGGTQTLEPRLFYVYTPYRDQSQLPNFDTADGTFNLTQIFTENRFVGSDRIADANQVTAAIVSRFLQADGAERLRLTFGQRFYFADQRVQLTSTTPVNQSRSDILLAATGRVSETWTVDSLVQYNPSSSQLVSSTYSVQYQPGPKKVLNVSNRFQRDSFRNAEVSGQWPLTERLYGVGRVSYSLLDRRLLEGLVGLEYKGDCWVFRMGAQRFVTSAKKSSTPIFFQLELTGLSNGLGLGANGLETFTKTIPGYQALNPPIR